MKRLAIIIFSVGWLIPFCISFWAVYDFVHNIMWPTLGLDEPTITSYHPIQWAIIAFSIAMVWLACAIIAWSFHLTRKIETQH
jgi:hypothetical protein